MKRWRESTVGSVPPEPAQRWRGLTREPLPGVENCLLRHFHRMECGVWLWPGHGVPGLRAAQRWRGLTREPLQAAGKHVLRHFHRMECGVWLWPGHGVPGLQKEKDPWLGKPRVRCGSRSVGLWGGEQPQKRFSCFGVVG